MHELSACRGILDAAEHALDDLPSSSQVVRIVIRVGRFAHLTREGLEYYFDLLNAPAPQQSPEQNCQRFLY